MATQEQLSAAAQKTQQQAITAALQCVGTALTSLQAEDTEQFVAARAAALGVAVEVLLTLGHTFAAPDATELIHWLVRGAEWTICESLAVTEQLQGGLIEECVVAITLRILLN